MKVVYAKHEPYKDGNLGLVNDELELAGPPTIRVIKRGDEYFAVEGSHRLYLCHKKGIIPKLVSLIPDLPEDMDEYWNSIIKDLPRYEFDHVLVLDMEEWIKEMGN